MARAVCSADTVFDQLIFLGSLRDAYTGRYLHEGWVRVASPEEIHRQLGRAHQSSFESVVKLSIVELSKQLRFHFQSIGRSERETSLLWLEAEPFRDLIPPGCSAVLRELFISQVKTALEVLSRVPDWADLRAPIALPHSQPDQSPLPLCSD
jgi:hypothetical protein